MGTYNGNLALNPRVKRYKLRYGGTNAYPLYWHTKKNELGVWHQGKHLLIHKMEKCPKRMGMIPTIRCCLDTRKNISLVGEQTIRDQGRNGILDP